jgi:hypothetical protein
MAKKQPELEIVGKGVAPVSFPEIDKLADNYIAERDKGCDRHRAKSQPKAN